MISASAAGTWTLGDRTVNRMGFGSMRLTGNPDTAPALRVLRRAVELGVNHIDTAAFYTSHGGVLPAADDGPPRYATELIRRALAPYPSDLVIVTKVGPGITPGRGFHNVHTKDELRVQVEENCTRLGVTALDVVNLRVADGGSVAARFQALADLRAEGLIRHLGLSNISRRQLDEVGDIAPVVCVQNRFGLDDRSSRELLDVCGERGIAFVPFFAIANAAADGEHLRAVAAAHGVTTQQVRLAWTLNLGPHVLAIPGTGTLAHLEENVAAGALTLSADEMAGF